MKLKEIFEYRNIWMAIAIIMVFFFHLEFESKNIIIQYIKGIGYGGVDIFLFASGLGCYFSLNKNKKTTEFIKKRIIRIIPTYWTFLIFYFLFKYYTDRISIMEIIGNMFCFQSIINPGNDFNWYMSAMWILYIVAPLLFKIINKINTRKELIIIITLLVVYSIPFWNVDNLIIIITRIPIFFIGMYMAKKSVNENYKINKKDISILTFIMVLGFSILSCFQYFFYDKLWTHGLFWYPFILITPGFCFIISYISSVIKKINVGNVILKILKYIGKYTFEIYLVHILMISLVKKIIDNSVDVNIKNLTVIILTLLGCILLKILTNTILILIKKSKINNIFKKRKKISKFIEK